MVVRKPVVMVVVLLIVALLAGIALLIPRGGERLVAHAASKLSASTLRDCLGSRLGLTWQGDDKAMHASTFGTRVVVTDAGTSRQIGMFTAGGRKPSSSERAAMQACLVAK